METLINNINGHVKQLIEKEVMEYFSQYEDKISEKISNAYNLKFENVKQMVSCIINERNQLQKEQIDVKTTCIGKTKAGKPCKYTCVDNGNMCNKHLKMKDAAPEESVSKRGECSNTKKPLKEKTRVGLSSLPADEASWFKKYSDTPNYTNAYYPNIESDTDEYVVNE